jgi:hypothetical protein
VLAITAPLDAALAAVVAEQDLAIVVTPDTDGPLARLALASLAPPPATTRPLARGLTRWLARSGLAPPTAVRELVRW